MAAVSGWRVVTDEGDGRRRPGTQPYASDRVRLSQYPHVVLRVSCRTCPRRGRYRIVRLAERYGAEILLLRLIDELAKGCPQRSERVNLYRRCRAFFPDLDEPLLDDQPTGWKPANE